MATQTPQPPDPAALYRKLAIIAGAIGRVEKDGYNPQLKYKYPTPATIMEAVKPLLTEHKIAIVPQVSNVIKEATGATTQSGAAKVLTRVEMTFLLLDGESGATLAVPWVGEGEDWSDKGIAKAQTIALRTFLVQLFQIPSGDDVDPDASQAQPPRGASYEKPAPARPAPQPNGAKSRPSRESLVTRIGELTKEVEKLGMEVLMGDGTPMGSATIAAMTHEELIAHGKNLKAAIEEARKAQETPA